MILSKDSNNNWTPTAGGTGTFIGTLAAFNAIKDTLPVNTVAYITDDGNGDLVTEDEAQAMINTTLNNRFKGLSMTYNSARVNADAGDDFMSYIAAADPNSPTSPEGGEIGLGRSPNSTHITGHVTIDVYADKVRFFCTYDGQTRIFTIDFGTKTTYWN